MATLPGRQRLSFFSLSLLLLSFFHLVFGQSKLPLKASDSQGISKAPSLSLLATAAADPSQNDFTCGPGKPCVNEACCGEDGWCGYAPKYCGTGCQSNCDAKAECGQYAAKKGQECPLNVCCSEHGFCGTTEEFCNKKCQSNCETPKPNASPSNPRDIIIGYWEAWNMDKPCGTMGPGEIPVHMLTHLFVSFGYINDAWEVTNMDGIDPEILKSIGNVKARNPDLKIVIALGGWAFSDPGPWRNIFPDLASSKANRATFIKNLLGFLSEYGYDGVDFDWEYPGAKDRGGADGDGENYTALLKELRAAIKASGRDYIVTFTAPSSYWYLRHFDLKGMEEHVDWINLMSYDLHGVWDSDNPIGNQVLSHTNLTEIDLALDLFWRVGVEPSSIVMGLGFYGRSFELTNPSCWKPGCKFEGPGAEGRCSKAAGILAYNEIMEILEETGGKPYLDEKAAARYMVYNGHSWISFDDEITFELKVKYAAKMGLRGLMIWAIDLDTGNLDALKAVTGKDTKVPGSNSPFSLVDLDRLFPPDMLPDKDATKNWGLVNFGTSANGGTADPNDTGFGFILVTGESHAMTSLKKRKDNPEPLVFLDCPSDVESQPKDKAQKARVVCLSEDVKGCFQLMNRGVEGTIVEMPDNCAPNSFARAISLEKSQDQSVPKIKGRSAPSSEVFDFTFDLNIKEKRQDAGKFQVRVDYSNTNGYWNAAVDSPGKTSSSSSEKLDKRYHASAPADWRSMYANADEEMKIKHKNDVTIKESINAPLYWDDIDKCKIEGEEYKQGFAAHVEGTFEAQYTYGFSMIADYDKVFDVKQANGWLQVDGESDFTFSVGGVGTVDLDKSGKGNPSYTKAPAIKRKGHSIEAGPGGAVIDFTPYWKLDYMLGAFNDTDSGSSGESGPFFDGQLSLRVKSDFGNYRVNFPPNPEDKDGSRNLDRRDNRLSFPEENNKLYNINTAGRLSLMAMFDFGLDVKFQIFGDLIKRSIPLTDMRAHYRELIEFEFYPSVESKAEACVHSSAGTLGFQSYDIDEDNTLGWGEHEALPYVIQDSQSPASGPSCYPELPSIGQGMPWGYGPGENIDPNTFLSGDAGNDFGSAKDNKFQCSSCVQCGDDEFNSDGACCGCVNLDLLFGYDDMPRCEDCAQDDGTYPGAVESNSQRSIEDGEEETLDSAVGLGSDQSTPTLEERGSGISPLEKRASGIATMSQKKVTVCPGGSTPNKWWLSGAYSYPAFPAAAVNPWDGIEQGKWDSISRYWGNTSVSCSNWDVSDLQPHDTAIVSGNRVRAKYQTEHVFEGQLIGDFFSWWLDKGHINRQDPPARNPQSKVPCSFTRQYILSASSSFPWKLDGTDRAFIYLLLAELGNAKHLDRLTILKARPNRMKGSMFTGNQPVSVTSFLTMSSDAQLTATKEMGMVFNYLNEGTVWDAFCGTYEAIYDQMGRFDTWLAGNGAAVGIPSLQKEWKEYIETVLASLVNRSKTTFDNYFTIAMASINPTPGNIATYSTHWVTNNSRNKRSIKITGTCPHLSSIPP